MIEMKEFTIQGTLLFKAGERKFSRNVKAFNENHAKGMVLSLFGSEHKLSRRKIKIKSVAVSKEVK